MLSLETIEEAIRMLKTNELSQREIARRLGISRGTVNNLANGRRGVFGREAPASAESPPPTRCPTCGRVGPTPCVYCQAVEYRRRAAGGRAA